MHEYSCLDCDHRFETLVRGQAAPEREVGLKRPIPARGRAFGFVAVQSQCGPSAPTKT
jgi:hypothetical protein